MPKKYVLAIDLGGTNTKMAVVNRFGKMGKKINIETGKCKNKRRLIDTLIDEIHKLLKEERLERSDLAGVGMGVAGPTDTERGLIYCFVNVPGWENTPLAKIMAKRLGLPTFIDNDVNVMTLGELYYGAGKDAKNMVCLTLGTGVGGGIVINRKLYRGSAMVAGEIGHMPVNEEGPDCNCGGIACMEAYVGNAYIVKSVLVKLKAGEKSIIPKLVGGKVSAITPCTLTDAAKRGDRLAIKIWREIGFHIGVNLTGVINFMNPDKVVIGGGVANAGRFIFEPIRETIKKRAMPVQRKTVKIVKAKLGEDAGIIGAGVLAWIRLGVY